MAEKKQYFNQQFDKGTLLINEEVLETIVFNAVKEVEGFAGFSTKPSKDMIEIIGRKNAGKSLNIKITETNQLQVDCNVNVLYGQNVTIIAKNLQEAISDALASSANAIITAVNINVCGIICK